METVYLLHFATPYKHARHYLGTTTDLEARISDHRAGTGSRLMAVVAAAGITFEVARVWDGGRALEGQLKGLPRGEHGNGHRGSLARLCPVCRAQATAAEIPPAIPQIAPHVLMVIGNDVEILARDLRGRFGTRCPLHGHVEAWPSAAATLYASTAPEDWCDACADLAATTWALTAKGRAELAQLRRDAPGEVDHV